MSKIHYTEAFQHITSALKEIAELENRIPSNADCLAIIQQISDKLNVHLNLTTERTVLDNEIDTELFINRRVWGKNDLKIEVHYFYEGLKYGNYELNFYPDGKYIIYGGLVDAKFILAKEFEERNNRN